MSSIKFSATRKPGGRPPLGRGRPAVRNSTPSHVLEGAYMNPRMVHVLTSVVGARCELLVKSGKVFEGIFRTYGPKYEVVLDAAHQQSADSTQSGPKSEEIVNTMIFSPSDVVLVQYKDVDLNYATRDGFTDSVIVRRVNGEHRERELEPWQGGDGAGDDMSSLDTDMSNGWDPNEMFRYNEENYGVKSTYDSSLANYTTRLDKDSSEEFQKREARAEQLAREIESSPQYRTHAALENDDGRTEEDRFSSVQRRQQQQQQQPDRDGPTLYTRGRYVPPGQRSGPLGRGGGRQNSPKFGRQGAGPQPSRGGYRYPEPSPSPGLDHRALNGAGRGAIRSQVTQSPKPGQELSTPPGLMVGAPAGVQAFVAAGAGHAQTQPVPVTAIQPAPGMPQPVAWVSVPPPGVPQPSSAQAGALVAQQGVAAVAAAAHAPPSASKVPDVHLVATPATAPANTIIAAAQAPTAMAAAAATVATTAAFQQPAASAPVTGLSIPRGAVLSAAPTTSSGMTSGAESACQPQHSSAEGKETSIHVEQSPQNMIADQQQARAPGPAQPILQRAPSAVPVRGKTYKVPYQSVLEAKKNPIEELKRFSAEFKLNLNQAEPGPQEERSTRDKSKGDGAEAAAECSTGTQTTDTSASTQAANSGSQTAGSAVPQAVASLGTGGEVTATKPGSEGPNVSSESTPKAADVEGSKDKGESDATDSKKSNLNPNAKEFVLNPSAKPFIPMVKPVPTPTPPRPQQASPSVIMPAPQGPLYNPQPLAAYPPVIPINPVPAAYQVPVPLNQHKPYRPTKGTMPQIRSDHAHPQSNQAILHSVSMATVSAPPLGASYSHAFIPYSPQHYPSQPNLLHYQPLHQAGAVYPPLMQGGSRVLAAPQMGPGQAGLVGAPSSSSPQYPPNAESAPPPQTIYVSPAPVHQHYPPPHPGSLHALTAHAQQGAPTHAAPNQHPGGQQMPSAMQPQGGQPPHMGAPQQHQAAGLYPGGLMSQGPGPHGQPGGYPHPHAHPQHIYTIHPPHHGYSSPAGLPPNAQSHAAHPAPVMLMAAHPSSSGHGGPPGPPHPHQGPMSLSGVPSMSVSSGAPYAYMTLQPQAVQHPQQQMHFPHPSS